MINEKSIIQNHNMYKMVKNYICMGHTVVLFLVF